MTKAEILNACHGKVDGFYEPDKYEHQYKVVVKKPETAGKTSSQQDESLMNLHLTKKSVLDEGQGEENIPSVPLRKGGMQGGKKFAFWMRNTLIEIRTNGTIRAISRKKRSCIRSRSGKNHGIRSCMV